MKRLLWLPIITFALVACEQTTTSPSDTSGFSPTAPVFSMGAVVHHDEIGCAVIDGEGHWYPSDWSLPCGTETATFSKNSNASLSAQATGVPNPTGRIVHWGPYNPGEDWAASYPNLSGPPYPCFVLGPDYDLDNPLFTVHWKAHVTPSGKASLICHYSKKWEFRCEDYDNCA
jgi:hypothetical protein